MDKHNQTTVNHKVLTNKLLHILPEASALYQEEDLRPYECDGLSAYRQLHMSTKASVPVRHWIELLNESLSR